jgi:hypothetical protein
VNPSRLPGAFRDIPLSTYAALFTGQRRLAVQVFERSIRFGFKVFDIFAYYQVPLALK